MITVVYVFDSFIHMTSIIVSTWAAMADMKFHGDVILLFRRIVVVGCCRDDETHKCSAPRTHVENINFSGKFFSSKTKFWAKLRPRAPKTSAGSLFWQCNFDWRMAPK
jgi:hypothetical protein